MAISTADKELKRQQMVDMSFLLSRPGTGKCGKTLMNCRGTGIAAKGMTLVGLGRLPKAGFDFEVVRTAVGGALRSLYSHVLREPLLDRMVELLSQLDQPPESGQDADEA